MENSKIWQNAFLKHILEFMIWAQENLSPENKSHSRWFYEYLWGLLRFLGYKTTDNSGAYPIFIWKGNSPLNFYNIVKKDLTSRFNKEFAADFYTYLRIEAKPENGFPDLIALSKYSFTQIVCILPDSPSSWFGQFKTSISINIENDPMIKGKFEWEFNPDGYGEQITDQIKRLFRMPGEEVFANLTGIRRKEAQIFSNRIKEFLILEKKDRELRAREAKIKEQRFLEQQKIIEKQFSKLKPGMFYFIIKKKRK